MSQKSHNINESAPLLTNDRQSDSVGQYNGSAQTSQQGITSGNLSTGNQVRDPTHDQDLQQLDAQQESDLRQQLGNLQPQQQGFLQTWEAHRHSQQQSQRASHKSSLPYEPSINRQHSPGYDFINRKHSPAYDVGTISTFSGLTSLAPSRQVTPFLPATVPASMESGYLPNSGYLSNSGYENSGYLNYDSGYSAGSEYENYAQNDENYAQHDENYANQNERSGQESDQKTSHDTITDKKMSGPLSGRELCLVIYAVLVTSIIVGGVITWVVVLSMQEISTANNEIRRENGFGENKRENVLREQILAQDGNASQEKNVIDGIIDPMSGNDPASINASERETVAAHDHPIATIDEKSPFNSLFMTIGVGALVGAVFEMWAFHREIWQMIVGGQAAGGNAGGSEGGNDININPDAENFERSAPTVPAESAADERAASSASMGSSLPTDANDIRNVVTPTHQVKGGELIKTKDHAPLAGIEIDKNNVMTLSVSATKKIETDMLTSTFEVENYTIKEFEAEFMDAQSDWAIWKLGKFDDGKSLAWASDKNHKAYDRDFERKFRERWSLPSSPEEILGQNYDSPTYFIESKDSGRGGETRDSGQAAILDENGQAAILDENGQAAILDHKTDDESGQNSMMVHAAVQDDRVGQYGQTLSLMSVDTNFESPKLENDSESDTNPKKCTLTRTVTVEKTKSKFKTLVRPFKYETRIEAEEMPAEKTENSQQDENSQQAKTNIKVKWTTKMVWVNEDMVGWLNLWSFARTPLFQEWEKFVQTMIRHLKGEA